MSTSTAIMTAFELLPLEVLFLIVELFQYSPRDLKVLRRVSRRISAVAARFQFRRVAVHDTNKGRTKIKRVWERLGSYLARTR